MKDKKNFRFEFVVFNISQENAVFLWRVIVWWIEFLGLDVTGDVVDNDNLETSGMVYAPIEPEDILVDHARK